MTIRIEAATAARAACAIREQVFIRERDWRPEFDEWDAASVHLLCSIRIMMRPIALSSAQLASRSQPIQPSQNHPVATCRFYADPDHPDQPGRYIIARLAVLPEAQGRHIGSRLTSDAERRIAQAGGTMTAVHSENDHYKFYEQCGYRLTDEVYEGGRHGWLIKDLIGSENYGPLSVRAVFKSLQ